MKSAVTSASLILGLTALFSVTLSEATPPRQFENHKLVKTSRDFRRSRSLSLISGLLLDSNSDSIQPQLQGVVGNINSENNEAFLGENVKVIEGQTSAVEYENGFEKESASERKGQENYCDCGARHTKNTGEDKDAIGEEGKIVGGLVADEHEFPWRCNLRVSNGDGTFLIFCGCAILSNKFILTAAHCTKEYEGYEIFVDVGNHDLISTSNSESKIIKAKKINQHPSYNSPSAFNNDIAILELETPLEMNSYISPVCLPYKLRDQELSNVSVVASGWGTVKEGVDLPSHILRKVDLSLLTTDKCRQYPKIGSHVTDNMICTYDQDKDTCQGDSGGSIDYRDPASGKYYAVGVVSFGSGCGRKDSPGVYTKLTNYLDYVDEITGGGFCTN